MGRRHSSRHRTPRVLDETAARDLALTRNLALLATPLGSALIALGIAAAHTPLIGSGIGALVIAAVGGVQVLVRRPHPSSVVIVGATVVVALSSVQLPPVTYAAALCLAAIGTPVILYHNPPRAYLYLTFLAATLAHLIMRESGFGIASFPALLIVAAAVVGGATLYGDTTTRLRRSEARFREAFENAPVAMALVEGTTIRWVNGAFTQLLGFAETEVIGRDWDEFDTGAGADTTAVLAGISAGETRTLDSHRFSRSDGTTIRTRVAATGIGVAEPGRIDAVVQILDVTRQQAALEALSRAEERHRSVLELLPVALWEEDFTEVGEWLAELRAAGVTDLRRHLARHPDDADAAVGRILVTRVNPAAAQLVGASDPSAMVGTIDPETVTAETRPSFVEQFVAVWEERSSASVDVVGRTLEGEGIDGRLQWVAPVVGGRADLSRVLVAITDLTERRRAERELERRLALENLVAQLSTHFINLDSAATDRGIDQALEAIGRHAGAQRSYLFRLSESDDTITNTHEWCAPGIESMKDRIQRAPTAAFPWISARLLRGETVLLRSLADLPADAAAERAEFEAQGIVSLVNVPMVSGGETVGFVGLDSLTITQTWSDADVQLLNLVGQMLLNALERKVTDDRMAALMASKDQLVASVSHELRTPLTVVVGLVEELSNRMDLSDDDRADFVEVIRDQSHELTHIVEDLLVASRAGTGELAVSFEPVSLTRELESVLALLPRSDGRVPQVSGRAGLVRGDRLRIRQILRNLLSNALRYGGEHITVTLRDRTSTAEVIVADDGPGVPIGDRERVFEPFQRAHSTPGRPGSLGIGLAVSRQLARLMHGDLRFASGAGNAFVVELPLAAAPADGAARSRSQGRPSLIDEVDEPPTVPLLENARADRER